MTVPVIVIGDATSHGGVVIEGSAVSDTLGKTIARVGDRVTCPKKGHGTNVIVSGDASFIVDGRPVARHNDKTACGAVLISSQSVTTTSSGNSSSSAATSQAAQATSATAALAAQSTVTFLFDEQVQLAVAADRATLVGLPWFIETNDGRRLSGTLGPDGQMPRTDSLREGEYTTYWGDEARARAEGLA